MVMSKLCSDFCVIILAKVTLLFLDSFMYNQKNNKRQKCTHLPMFTTATSSLISDVTTRPPILILE